MKKHHSLNSKRRRFLKVSALDAATLPLCGLVGQRVALAQDTGNEAMTYFGGDSSQEIPAMDTGVIAAFLTDMVVSSDAEKPISAGLFRLEKGKPLTYTYTYNEVEIHWNGQC